MSIFGTTDAPVLNFWWCLLWVSKPEWETLFALGWGICDIHSLRFTSGVTPLPMYMASIVAGHFSYMHILAEIECWIWTTDFLLDSQMH